MTACGCPGECVWSWRSWRSAALEEARQLRVDYRTRLAASRRFPWAPVEAWLRGSVRPDVRGNGNLVELNDTLAGDHLGAHPQTVGRWRRAGWLSAGQADSIATRLGLHPLNLWPDYYDPEPAVDTPEETAA